MSSQSEIHYKAVWPKSPLAVQTRPLVERLDTLEGKRVGFLWDFLFRGHELFPVIEKELRNRFTGIEIVGYDEFGNTHGGDEAEVIAALPNRLRDRRIDAVVSGVGC